MARFPGPVRRVARHPARVTAVALLALVSLAAAGINITAADRLQALLDENWRGAYDILVTAEGSEVAGLLAPNSLAGGSESMTIKDLDEIRSVDGVEVAAPIGEVIIPAFSGRQERFVLPLGVAGANEVPQAFRVTVSRHTNDGLGERLMSTESYPLVVDETPRPDRVPEPCIFDDYEVDPEKYPLLAKSCGYVPPEATVSYPMGDGWGTTGEVVDGRLLFSLGGAFKTNTRVALVDPDAERALLGDAGDFLQPLQELSPHGPASADAVETWSRSVDNEYTREFARQNDVLDSLLNDHYGWMQELQRLYEDNGSSIGLQTWESDYVPLLVRKTGPAPLNVTLTVEAFGPATLADSVTAFGSSPFDLPAALEAGDPGALVGTVTADASTLLNPFSNREMRIPWPGSSTDVGEGQLSPFELSIHALGTAQPPAYRVTDTRRDGVEVEVRASGYLTPVMSLYEATNLGVLAEDGTVVGMESAFVSEFRGRPVVADSGFAAVPVGGFSLERIDRMQSELSHVPLGAYHATAATLLPNPTLGQVGTVELAPSVSGLGLVSPETIAIASIESVVAMGQPSPINAVRVRVADVEERAGAGVATIAAVAQELRRLGFVATIVAGSSPTDVTLHVDDYAFGVSSADEEQEVGYLGAVTQRWSELGAASRVDLAVSVSSLAVLAVALAASVLLLGAVQLASVPGRRAQASLMRTVGWERRQVFRWMAAEELVLLTVFLLAGAAAVLMSVGRPSVVIVVGASAAVLVGTSALAVMLGSRPAVGRSLWRRLRERFRGDTELDAWVTSTFRFAVRHVLEHWTAAAVQVLATVVVAVSAAAVAVTVLQGRSAAGDSALGEFAFDQEVMSQVGLGLLALAAGTVLAVIARRIGLKRRREQWTAMSAMGFSAGQLRLVQLTEALLAAAPSLIAAGASVWFYAEVAGPEFREASLLVAAGAAGVLTIILVLTGWREKR